MEDGLGPDSGFPFFVPFFGDLRFRIREDHPLFTALPVAVYPRF